MSLLVGNVRSRGERVGFERDEPDAEEGRREIEENRADWPPADGTPSPKLGRREGDRFTARARLGQQSSDCWRGKVPYLFNGRWKLDVVSASAGDAQARLNPFLIWLPTHLPTNSPINIPLNVFMPASG